MCESTLNVGRVVHVLRTWCCWWAYRNHAPDAEPSPVHCSSSAGDDVWELDGLWGLVG